MACGEAGIQLSWDQHIGLSSSGLSSVYKAGWPAAARSMGKLTNDLHANSVGAHQVSFLGSLALPLKAVYTQCDHMFPRPQEHKPKKGGKPI